MFGIPRCVSRSADVRPGRVRRTPIVGGHLRPDKAILIELF